LLQKIGATNLVGVPATEGKTTAVARGRAAFGPIALVTTESDKLRGIDLDGQKGSGEERDSETHCRRSIQEDLMG
jgi:hypothetical protein